ncbi:MAG: discoidin domain-containing protein [Caldilineaceae bacterium]|nr:discoidin domain-containing protein [Caldilineaceae bacterium]
MLLGLLPVDASAAPSAETAPFPVTGNITAHVYRDFNGNGTRESAGVTPETGVYGVRLSLYDANGVLVATNVTNANGDLGLAASLFAGNPGPYRAEFTELPAGYAPSGAAVGTQNGTTVQFILEDTAAARDLHLGILIPSDYSASGADPLVAVPAMTASDNSIVDALGNSGIATERYSLISNSNTKSIVATNVQVGSVWGQGWQASENRLFTGAYAKRHSGFGPQGPGGVYVTDFTNPASPTVTGFTLQGVTPTNGGASIDLGSIDRSSGPDYVLSTDPANWSIDLDAFGKIGKVAYGDVDVDFTGRRLWLVNLNQRALITLDISGPVTNGVVPGAANQYLLSSASGLPSCTGTIRPFGLEFYGETGYLGVVCDGNDNGSRVRANLRGYVLSFAPPALGDTATTSLSFSTVLEIPMDYRDNKGEVAQGPWNNADPSNNDAADTEWQPWVDNYDDTLDRGYTSIPHRRSYPQPVVSDIEIDPTGNMTIGIMSRWGDQMGDRQQPAVSGGGPYPAYTVSTLQSINNAGDMIKACRLGAVYALESTDYRCAVADPGLPTTGTNNGLGLNTDGFSGDGEFYWGDAFYTGEGTHWETTDGGLGMWPGKREILSNAFDPNTAIYSNGVIQLNMLDGSKIAGWTVVPTQRSNYFGKGNSMGDIEILNEAAPIELGNRIWADLNGDGIQDPNEDPLAGVTVTLWADTNGDGTVDTQVGTTLTSATGEWYFGGPDNVKMTGGNSIQPYTAYEVRVNTTQPALSGMTLTQANAPQPANGDASASDNDAVTDVADSDAVMSGTTAVIAYTTGPAGSNNHGLDYGFVSEAAIGNYVWLDENNDGEQNAGERGIPNVVVTLTPPANVDLGHGFGQPITTVTDANGGYLFSHLPAADGYVVTVDGAQSALGGHGLTYTVPNTTDTDGDGDANRNNEDFGNQNPAGYTIDLSPGETDLSADFGYNYNTNTEVNDNTGVAAIGDRVWIDSDGDGKQDPNEVGVEGVEVTLYTAGPDGIFGTADDVAAGTTTTDANGYYIFDNLTPGAYAVGVTNSGGASQDVLGSSYTQTGDPDHFGTTGTNNDNYGEPVVLAPGDVFLNMDFGYQPGTAVLNSIGDTIFYDADADGNGPSLAPVDGGAAVTQGAGGTADAMDYGISGVTVSLIDDLNGNDVWDAGEPIIATDVTDENGQYLFEDLPDGDYIVWVNDADGVLSGLNQSYDADGLATPNTSAVSVAGGQHNRLQDFGYTNNQPGVTPKGTIGDTVWYDLDGDGVQDANEAGIAGVEVELCGLSNNLALNMPATASESHVSSVPSDANDGNRDGNYGAGSVWTAANISPSSTWWQVDLGSIQDITRIDLYGRTGYGFRNSHAWVLAADTDFSTTANLDTLAEATANANYAVSLGDMTGVDFKQLLMSTSGRYIRVWGDTTPYLNLAELEVYDETCQTTVTDENGKYLFTDLTVDADGETYTVTVNPTTLPGGLTQTYDYDGLGTPNTSTTTISTANPIDLDQDFGYNGNNSLGNLVWTDSNADGVYDLDGADNILGTDDDEPLIDGVTLDIYRDVNGNGFFDSEDALVTSVVTNGNDGDVAADNGNYLVTGLPDGTYFVNVSDDDGVLNGYWHSLGTPNLTNNSQDDAYYRVELDPTSANPSGVQNLTADFGYYVEPAAVGNYIWTDLTPDGIQDPSEPPIEGVEVKMVITYPDGTITTLVTKTDATGYYSFPNLLLDEDYAEGSSSNAAVTGPPAQPSFIISVDPNQDVLLTLAETVVNNDTNPAATTAVTDDSNEHSGTVAKPVQGQTDTTLATADGTNIASYDFGYKAVLALGGTLWNDNTSGTGTANDGIYQVGEEVLDGVTVKLYTPNLDGSPGAPVDDPRNPGTPYSVVTDANGAYLFDGLAPGDYMVVIENFVMQTGLSYSTLGALDPDDTTTGNIDTGYENVGSVYSKPVTLNPLAQATADGEEPNGEWENSLYSTALTGSQDGRMNYNVDLGFTDEPLSVSLSYAYAERGGDGTVYFIWETATETGNAGFNLYMELADASQQLVNSELVPSSVIDSVMPTHYTYQASVAGERYYIELVSVDGATERYGPYELGQEYGEPTDADGSALTNPLYLPLIMSR